MDVERYALLPCTPGEELEGGGGRLAREDVEGHPRPVLASEPAQGGDDDGVLIDTLLSCHLRDHEREIGFGRRDYHVAAFVGVGDGALEVCGRSDAQGRERLDDARPVRTSHLDRARLWVEASADHVGDHQPAHARELLAALDPASLNRLGVADRPDVMEPGVHRRVEAGDVEGAETVFDTSWNQFAEGERAEALGPS